MKYKHYYILSILLILIIPKIVLGDEKIDLTKDSVIKYKWYINEEVDGKYYKKGEDLPGYLEDSNRVKYGKYSDLSISYCNYSKDQYVINEYIDMIYQVVVSVKYIKLINFNEENPVIEIYSNLKKIPYKIIFKKNNELIIELEKYVNPEDMFFYIESQNPYDIYLSHDRNFTQISLISHIEKGKILIPDKKWISDKTQKSLEISNQSKHGNDFRHFVKVRRSCKVKEILTYRYKLKKKYYDSKYHDYIPKYLPDLNDYIIEYKGKLPVKIVEVINTIKEYVPKKEIVPVEKYIYLKPEPKEVIKYVVEEQKQPPKIKYLEKEVIKKIEVIPKKAYMVMIGCILIMILEFVFLIKKKVD